MSRMNEPVKSPCPKCGKQTVKKGISATTMGADMNLTPDKATGGDWSRLMDKVKKSTPKREHDRLDSYTSNSGGHLGPK